jgi:hypothetical protein
MQVEIKGGLHTLREVCPKSYFLLHQVVQACLPRSLLHDERFLCFKIRRLPFLIAHHPFPITHSFDHHFTYSLLPPLQVSCKTTGNSPLEPAEPFSRLLINQEKYTTDTTSSRDGINPSQSLHMQHCKSWLVSTFPDLCGSCLRGDQRALYRTVSTDNLFQCFQQYRTFICEKRRR